MFNENHQEDYDVEEWSVEKDIQRKQRISRKGKKHVKDKVRNKTRHEGKFRRYHRCPCCWTFEEVAKERTHKHKRAERAYTSEECEIYYDWTIGEGGDYSDDFYDVGMYGDTEWETLCDQTAHYCDWYNKDLSEMGCDEYRSDYDWEYELYSCVTCGTSGYCDCTETDRTYILPLKHTSQMCNIKLYLLRACLKEGE